MIYKYPLQIQRVQVIDVPRYNHRILSLKVQRDIPVLYIECGTAPDSEEKVKYEIQMRGTGQDAPPLEIIDTVMVGSMVWHFFDGGVKHPKPLRSQA